MMILVLIVAYGMYFLEYIRNEDIVWFPAIFLFVLLILTAIREYMEKKGIFEK